MTPEETTAAGSSSAARDAAAGDADAAETSSRFALILFAVASFAAAILRIVYLLPLRGQALFDEPHRDSTVYVERAREILAGDWLGSGVSFHSAPLYPFFLAAVMGPAGDEGLWWVRIVQALISALTVGILTLTALRLFGRAAAVVTAILSAFYAPFLFYAGELLEITLTLFFLSLTAWFLARERPSSPELVAAGAGLGLAALGKPNLLLLAPLALAYLGFPRPWSQPARWPWRQGILLLLGLLVVILPFTLKNRVAGDDWVLISSNGGINLFIGNNPQATGGFQVPTAMRYDLEASSLRVAEEAEGRELKPSEASRFWAKRAWAFFTKRPAAAARNLARKAGLLVNHYEIPNHFNIYFFKEYLAPLLRWPLVWFQVVLPLAGLGLVFHARRSRATRFAAWSVLVVGLSVVLFFVTSRYRLPIMVWLLPFAGAGLMTLFRLLRSKRWRLLPIPLLIVLAVAALLRLPLVEAEDFHEDWITIGNYWARVGDWERVIFYNQQALRENMNSATAWHNLGNANLELVRGEEDLDRAEECLWRAITIDPSFAHAYGNLASLYNRVNRPFMAKPCLDKAIALDPALKQPLDQLRVFIDTKLSNHRERTEGLLKRVDEGLAREPGKAKFLLDKASLHGLRLEEYDEALAALDRITPEAAAADPIIADGMATIRARIERARRYAPLLDQPVR